MKGSKSKPESAPADKRPATPFARKAQKAMQKAQRTAARENARFGLQLIVKEG